MCRLVKRRGCQLPCPGVSIRSAAARAVEDELVDVNPRSVQCPRIERICTVEVGSVVDLALQIGQYPNPDRMGRLGSQVVSDLVQQLRAYPSHHGVRDSRGVLGEPIEC